MKDPGIATVCVWKVSAEGVSSHIDALAAEEPLEIVLHGAGSVSITMRTPGNDADLACGFLYSEGIITKTGDIAGVSVGSNTVTVTLTPEVSFDPARLTRHFYASSSCGVCGKASLDAIASLPCPLPPLKGKPIVSASIIHGLARTLREAQTVFTQTGGLHASACFDTRGTLLDLAEDVGRHNALDKLVGKALRENQLPLSERILLVSGRTSFEIVQKAVRAGFPILTAIGAPSSLAVTLAQEFDLTLLGFVRENRFNIYSSPWRIAEAARA